MIPSSFDYVSPKSLKEAVGLLESKGEGAKIIAGGQSLIPLMKLRLASPSVLIDLGRIPGLNYLREEAGALRIGAMTRMSDVAASEMLRKKYPIIQDAAKVIADPLIRNLGTMGGNVSHGDPTNDMPAVMLALGADFFALGPSGERTIGVRDFFLDAFSVALEHNEILTEIRVPTTPPRSGGSYLKIEQKVADFATAGVAVQITLSKVGQCETVGIGLTAVGPKAIEAKDAEDSLVGVRPTDTASVRKAAQLAADASDPASDIRGTADYKRSLVKLLVTRGVKVAYARSQGRASS